MNLQWPLPRRYSVTMPPWFVLLFTTILIFLQVTQAQNGNNNDNDAEEYYNNDSIFPRPLINDTKMDAYQQSITELIPSSSPLPVENDGCVCVRFWLCPNKTIITDGATLIDISLSKMMKVMQFIGGLESYKDHFENYPTEKIGTWASENEIFSMALMLKTNILTFSTIHNKWQMFHKSGSLKNTRTDSEKSIYIQNHNNGHFEVVVDVEMIDIKRTCENYLDKCCDYPVDPASSSVIIPTKEERQQCGTWNYNGIGFQIAGNINHEAKPGEFPWMVIILNVDPNDKTRIELMCGGSLIHPKVILTAAHCLSSNLKLEDLIVRAGEWDLKQDQERSPHQDRKVLRMVKHEKFSKGSGYNDIALIFLTEPFVLQPHISTVCLPPQDFKFHESDEENCKASGWGINIDGVKQAILKNVVLSIVGRDACEVKYKQSYGMAFKLHNSFICAGGINGKNTCKGDGGGPLVCPGSSNSTSYHQAGIVSWGIGCGNGYPGLYTDVSQFRNWIDQQMIGLDQSYYDANYVV